MPIEGRLTTQSGTSRPSAIGYLNLSLISSVTRESRLWHLVAERGHTRTVNSHNRVSPLTSV
jgi:hypothetical protein